MNRIILLFLILVGFVSFSGREIGEIQYFHAPTYEAKDTTITYQLVNFNDTIPSDTLFIVKNEDGLAHSYYRNILTGVCIHGKCRLLNISLFWSITGRYLGFKLPSGEFLSKAEHHPFKAKDYERLHELLADPYSSLAHYRLKELVPEEQGNEVDGVTAATIAGVKDYIVEDAVFTTYTIWHIVYGNTRNEIQSVTRSVLSPALAVKILNSESKSDVIWGLENLPNTISWTEGLQRKIFGLVKSGDIDISLKAIEAIPSNHLSNDQSQLALFSSFDESPHRVKQRILSKLEETTFLSAPVKLKLLEMLPKLNGSMVKSVLDLFSEHQLSDQQSEEIIASLLDHENRFIARKAFQYLAQHPTTSKKIERQLKKYESKNN